jgi:hypothetical protein
VRRKSTFFTAVAYTLLLLAACSGNAPAPPAPSLPTLADDSLERECACLERGDCAHSDAFEGQGEIRGFLCRWEDRAAGRATCTRESRSKPDAPPSVWSSWSRTTVRFRHLGERGWCWMERSSENELTN